MASSLRAPDAGRKTDCSSFYTLCCKEGGAPDPNKRGYDGYGYTGSMWPLGVAVSTPQPGDAAFYGGSVGTRRNDTTHMALCINSGEVVSFGHTPITRFSLRYRSDFRGCRSYL